MKRWLSVATRILYTEMAIWIVYSTIRGLVPTDSVGVGIALAVIASVPLVWCVHWENYEIDRPQRLKPGRKAGRTELIAATAPAGTGTELISSQKATSRGAKPVEIRSRSGDMSTATCIGAIIFLAITLYSPLSKMIKAAAEADQQEIRIAESLTWRISSIEKEFSPGFVGTYNVDIELEPVEKERWPYHKVYWLNFQDRDHYWVPRGWRPFIADNRSPKFRITFHSYGTYDDDFWAYHAANSNTPGLLKPILAASTEAAPKEGSVK